MFGMVMNKPPAVPHSMLMLVLIIIVPSCYTKSIKIFFHKCSFILGDAKFLMDLRETLIRTKVQYSFVPFSRVKCLSFVTRWHGKFP